MSRRDEIRMTGDEIAGFLAEQRTVICSTIGRDGWPHVMPLWYVVRAGELWSWTYGKSQKVRNLERDARATLQVEAGERYDELRGVMIQADTEISAQPEVVFDLGVELAVRYGGVEPGPDAVTSIRAQSAKRVALRFVPRRIASWDHRKLAGAA